MAFPCNPWVNHKLVSDAAHVAACKQESARAAQFQLDPITFMAVVLSALERLAVDGVTGFQLLSAYSNCDGEQNASNAYVCNTALSLPFATDPVMLQQIILWQLGNALCENDA